MNNWGEIIDMPEHALKCFILQQVSQAARAGAGLVTGFCCQCTNFALQVALCYNEKQKQNKDAKIPTQKVCIKSITFKEKQHYSQ